MRCCRARSTSRTRSPPTSRRRAGAASRARPTGRPTARHGSAALSPARVGRAPGPTPPPAATSKGDPMSTFDDAKHALEDAGTQVKADLWKPDDKAVLEQRARDLAELAAKATATSDPGQRAAYLAAARDTVTAVKVLARRTWPRRETR